MTDHPIIFSAPMVLALLREAAEHGTGKSQTRRLAWGDLVVEPSNKSYVRRDIDALTGWSKPSAWQRVKSGDRLWVRENLRLRRDGEWLRSADNSEILWPAHSLEAAKMVAWAHHKEQDYCPSIHMPRWASRLTLTVTGTKIERLHDISAQDAEREGVAFEPGPRPFCYVPGIFPHSTTAVELGGGDAAPIEVLAFAKLWNFINGAGAWEANPEVVALTFTVQLTNVDALREAS